ncbi:ethanolamine kinase 1 isoform X2 [Hydra vulgaris]|uniref:ethanolamine kinase n=1 Tax=Hydra vulgaris TaxID=6087 RepID=A0ABM4BDT3_HYDVU
MASSYINRLNDIPHFEVKITDKNVETTVQLLISHLKKSWNINKLNKKVYDSGITNKLYGYYVNYDGTIVSPQFSEYGRSEIVLVRIYGNKTDLVIDRAQELRNFEELSRCGIAPSIYCTFSNGYCYKYMEGRALNPKDFSDKNILNLCARQVANIHCLQLSENYLKHYKLESVLFKTINRYISLIPHKYNSEEMQKKYLELIPSIECLHSEVNQIISIVANMKTKVVFCHNDLLCGNFIFDEYNDKVVLIDYEYASPNYAAYDIANHFNEYAGIEDFDFSLYPSKEAQMEWLNIYIIETNKIKGLTVEVSEKELECLYSQVQVFSLVSHLFWGIWALIQAHYSDINFDFLWYSSMRLNEYFKHKDAFLTIGKNAEFI